MSICENEFKVSIISPTVSALQTSGLHFKTWLTKMQNTLHVYCCVFKKNVYQCTNSNQTNMICILDSDFILYGYKCLGIQKGRHKYTGSVSQACCAFLTNQDLLSWRRNVVSRELIGLSV